MKGQIVEINSDLHYVKVDNNIYTCKCRGIFRKEHITPVVGDYVLLNKDKNIIDKVLPRRNIFVRPKVSNIDQAILVTSLKLPDISYNLLDKFIVMMEINKVRPIICITKSDLLDEDSLNKISNSLKYYESIGYRVVYNYDTGSINDLLKDKTTVVTGQTGAGKSTLLNKLDSSLNLGVGDVSIALGRGRHTTRIVKMYEVCGGRVIDTPGFSSMDNKSYTKEEIRDAFVEFQKYPCKYKDCFHTNEEECSVKRAVLENNILETRYLNYLSFLEEVDKK